MTPQERINQRFAKDFNLPINIFRNDIFEYYRKLYDFWPDAEWVALNNEIKNDYEGNMEAWLQHYAEVRDVIIRTLEESQAYKDFNACDMSQYAVSSSVRNYPDRNIYNQECEGKIFLSIDLKKANFQALKFAGVITDKSYDDFIDKFDKSFYFKKSKYTRQVIFGKLNPKRTITVEHYMMSLIFWQEKVMKAINYVGGKVVAFKSDEIIWELDKQLKTRALKTIENVIKLELGFEVRAECFRIHDLGIVNSNGNKVSAWVREDLNAGYGPISGVPTEGVLKATSTTYFPQVYKLWKGYPLEDIDLYFYHEDQLATFLEPLRFDYESKSDI